MTTDAIKSDYELTREALGIAKDIMEQAQQYGGTDWLEELKDNHTDRVHEFVDQHELIIYYHHARAICCSCNTDEGEAVLQDIGVEFVSFDHLCTQIAYFELYSRVCDALNTLICDAVEAAEEVAA